MKTNNLFQNLPSIYENIYTLAELQLFYKEIDTIVSNLYHENTNLEHSLTELVSPEKKEKLLSYLKDGDVDISKQIKVQEALLKLKTIGESIPMVSMVLAFEPTEQILKNLSLWFSRNLNKKVLFSISLERQELGGAYITYNGLYKDLTVSKKVDEYFNNQKLEARI